jgi:ribose transport system substrate-binding protein
VGPISPESQTEALKSLALATHLVTLDADAPDSQRMCHFGLRDVPAGRLCARGVQEAMPQGGEIIVLAADLSQEKVADQIRGFQETLNTGASSTGASAWEVVEYLADGGDPSKRVENLRRALVLHPRVGCIVDMTSRSSAPLVQALADAGRLGDLKVFTFDESDETFDAIERGQVHATIARDPYACGYFAVRGLISYCRSTSLELPVPGRGSSGIPGRLVRQDNVGEFRSRGEQVYAYKWGG